MGQASGEALPEALAEALIVAGPTCSGKSALAMALAERIGGTVINADSMQVYADLRILSARPNAAEEAMVPHRLYGHVDGAVNYSAMRYAADVAELLEALRAEGSLPILVGGTGLYFKAVTEGFSAMPPVPEAVRAAFRAHAEGRERRGDGQPGHDRRRAGPRRAEQSGHQRVRHQRRAN